MAEFTAAKSRKKHCNLAVPSFSVELAPDVFNARLCTSQCTLPALKMDQLWTGRSTPSINTPLIMCKHTKGGKFYIASRLVLSMNKRNRNAFVGAEKVSVRVSLYRLLNPTTGRGIWFLIPLNLNYHIFSLWGGMPESISAEAWHQRLWSWVQFE